METPQGDPFADAAPPGGDEDPFAGVEPDTTDPADEVAAEPASAAEEQPPIVDREGIEQTPPASEEPAEAPEETPAAPEQPPAAEQPPAPPEDPPADTPPPASKASNGAGTTGPRGGKAQGEPRHYKVLYQTGKHQWAEHPLDQVPEGVNVVQDDGEKWVVARNNDHATRVAFAILGSPEAGVTVWPVPRGLYKPKRVKPAPPAPERTRLQIS